MDNALKMVEFGVLLAQQKRLFPFGVCNTEEYLSFHFETLSPFTRFAYNTKEYNA